MTKHTLSCATAITVAAIACATARARDVPGFGGTTVDAAPSTQASQPIDLDRDGILDLVTIASEEPVGLCARRHLNDGAGRFTLSGFGKFGLDGRVRDTLVADVDGDGLDDLVALLEDGRLHVSRGDGVGGLTTAANPITGLANCRAVRAGDVDGDGATDLVVAAALEVAFLRGRGDATFEPPATISTGTNVKAIELGELNGDGVIDLIIADIGEGTVDVLAGTGDGAFTALDTISIATPTDLALADFDTDGIDDLAVSTGQASDAIQVFRGGADGTFSPLSVVPTSRSFGLTVGDIDADGLPDLVDARALFVGPFGSPFVGDRTLRAFRSLGDGTFEFSDVGDTFGFVADLFATDLDGDLVTEIVVTWESTDPFGQLLDGGVQISHGRQDGFSLSVDTGESSRSAVGVDLDGDGDDDVVSIFGVDVTFLFVEDGEVVSEVQFDPIGASQPVFAGGPVVVADMTGDFLDDVLVGSRSEAEVLLIEQLSPGVYAEPVAASIAPFGWILDLEVLTVGSNTLIVALIEGENGFPRSRLVFAQGFAGDLFDLLFAQPAPGVEQITAVNLDGDLVDEIIEARADALVWREYPFDDESVTSLEFQVVEGNPVDLFVANADGDEGLELVYVTSEAITIRDVSIGPQGVFFGSKAQDDIEATHVIADAAVFDDDLDGIVEVAVSSLERNEVVIYSLGESGAPARLVAAGGVLSHGDLDRDGRTDLITSGITDDGEVNSSVTFHLRLDDIPWSSVSGGTAPPDESVPSLRAAGDPSPGSPVRLAYEGGRPGAPVFLLIGAEAAFIPLQIGLVVPAPQLLVTLPPTDAAGDLALDLIWSQLEPGVGIWAQAWQPAGPDTRASPGLTVVSR